MTSVSDIQKMVKEPIDLIINYVKSQTLVPLKRLVRYLGFGIGGSIFMALGLFLVNLAFLRYLQTSSPFEGTFSFVPYLIVVVVDIAGIGILYAIASRKSMIEER